MLCTFTNPFGAPMCARLVLYGEMQHGSANPATARTVEFYAMNGQGRDPQLMALGQFLGFETVVRLLARDADERLSIDSNPTNDVSAENLRYVLRKLGVTSATDPTDDDDEDVQLRQRLADLLTGVAKAFRGDPPPLTLWSWHDLPALAGACVGALRMVQVVANSGALREFADEPWLRSVAGALAACDDSRIDVVGDAKAGA
jgi:hypothetical protein